MSRLRRSLGVLFALILIALQMPGHAQIASADAQLSGFTYRLSDLDPNDGIAPSIAISPVTEGGRYYLSSSMAGFGYVREFNVIGEPGTTDNTTEFGSASTSTGSDFFNASARFTTPTSSYREFEGENEYEFRFSLSPYTRVEFLADVSLSAADPGGAVRSSARLNILGWLDALAPPEYEIFGLVKTVEDGSFAGQVYGELRTDADTTPGYFRIINAANVTANLETPPPVPEPSAIAMLLGGLLLTGAMVRRHGKR